ncbi:MAG: hypothetical protein AB1529_03740 [Candidatus Micrarchaeota archaeon]
MPRYKDTSGLFDALKIVALMAFLVFMAALILLGPILLERLRPAPEQAPVEVPENATPQPPPGAALYYKLKNKSCKTLSNDFLIETLDVSDGYFSGLMNPSEEERYAADLVASRYDSNQTTRTYVRGAAMKKVIITPEGNHTTIWKDGRIYQCNPECTMHLLGDAGWQAHLDELGRIRSGCAYFGRTALPDAVNMSRLISIRALGISQMNGFRCERFRIYGNKTYAQSLLSSMSLSAGQRDLLIAISHMHGPAEECLDDGAGLTVYRNITLDLSNSYRLDYVAGGGMFATQQTDMTYYTSSVPESFLALPK